jgi:zinc finger protein
MEKLENQPCPFCFKKTLTLTEDALDIPYFGTTYIFSMTCTSCKYDKSDIEAEESKEPCKLTFEVENTEDLKVRVVKSSNASINIPQMRMSVESGASSNGYVSNIEGLLNRFKKILEEQRDSTDDKDIRKKAKNLLKKLWKVECGEQKLKIIIQDPTGNSAIISEKTKIEKLKRKKK